MNGDNALIGQNLEWALGLGYLLGSVPFGLLLTRAFGAGDLRAIGSGNIGATNVLRTGRKGLAAATLLLDAGKGAAAVLLAGHLWAAHPVDAAALAGLAALIGHCYPIWLKFNGGKGVATMLGVSFAFDWRIGLASALVWAVVVLLTRISSAGGMASAVAAPVAAFGLFQLSAPSLENFFWRISLFVYGLTLLPMALLVIWKHRANIARLLAGTEPRIGQKG